MKCPPLEKSVKALKELLVAAGHLLDAGLEVGVGELGGGLGALLLEVLLVAERIFDIQKFFCGQ